MISPGLIRAGVELEGSTGAEQAITTVLGGLTAYNRRGRWATSQVDGRLAFGPIRSDPTWVGGSCRPPSVWSEFGMNYGAHLVVFSNDADANRTFLTTTLGLD